jgi:hypothetical protein
MDKTDTDHDSLLDRMVDFVSSTLEGAMNGRLLTKAARTKYFNPGGRIYLLPAFPVDLTAALTVTVDGTAQTINDDFFVYDETGIVEFPVDNVESDPKDVVVTWTGGYTEATGTGILAVPDDLEFACILQTSFMFRRRKDLGTSYILMPDGAASIPTKEGLLPQVQDIVDRYSLTYV